MILNVFSVVISFIEILAYYQGAVLVALVINIVIIRLPIVFIDRGPYSLDITLYSLEMLLSDIKIIQQHPES